MLTHLCNNLFNINFKKVIPFCKLEKLLQLVKITQCFIRRIKWNTNGCLPIGVTLCSRVVKAVVACGSWEVCLFTVVLHQLL